MWGEKGDSFFLLPRKKKGSVEEKEIFCFCFSWLLFVRCCRRRSKHLRNESKEGNWMDTFPRAQSIKWLDGWTPSWIRQWTGVCLFFGFRDEVEEICEEDCVSVVHGHACMFVRHNGHWFVFPMSLDNKVVCVWFAKLVNTTNLSRKKKWNVASRRRKQMGRWQQQDLQMDQILWKENQNYCGSMGRKEEMVLISMLWWVYHILFFWIFGCVRRASMRNVEPVVVGWSADIIRLVYTTVIWNILPLLNVAKKYISFWNLSIAFYLRDSYFFAKLHEFWCWVVIEIETRNTIQY